MAEGGFTVDSSVTFDFQPTFEIGASINSSSLQHADIIVHSPLNITQRLKINATGQADLNVIKPIIQPRKFIKVIAAGGIPIVISGEFGMSVEVTGHASGEANLEQIINLNFEDTKFGVHYEKGVGWTDIKQFEPSYTYTLNGEADAGANIEVRLIPDLQLHFYDAASGRILVEPYIYGDAAINGQLHYQNANGTAIPFSDLDYWFNNLQAGAGVDLRLYAGLHIFDVNLISYPEDVSVNEVDRFKFLKPLAKTPIAKLPELTVTVDQNAIPPEVVGDSRALLITGTANDVPNPLHNLFGFGLESIWPFEKWTDASVMSLDPAAQIIEENTAIGETRYWLSYAQPQQNYMVRLGGHSSVGWFVRQIAEFNYATRDQDLDGMEDGWEQRWGVDDPSADDDNDGANNLQEFEDGTVPMSRDSTNQPIPNPPVPQPVPASSACPVPEPNFHEPFTGADIDQEFTLSNGTVLVVPFNSWQIGGVKKIALGEPGRGEHFKKTVIISRCKGVFNPETYDFTSSVDICVVTGLEFSFSVIAGQSRDDFPLSQYRCVLLPNQQYYLSVFQYDAGRRPPFTANRENTCRTNECGVRVSIR